MKSSEFIIKFMNILKNKKNYHLKIKFILINKLISKLILNKCPTIFSFTLPSKSYSNKDVKKKKLFNANY